MKIEKPLQIAKAAEYSYFPTIHMGLPDKRNKVSDYNRKLFTSP